MPGRRQSVLGGKGDGNPFVAAVTAAAGVGGGGDRSNNAIGVTASGSLPARANALLACQIEIPAGTSQRTGDIFGGPAPHVDSLRLASCSSSAEAATTIKLQDHQDHVDGASGLLLRPRTLSFPLVHPAAIGGMQFTSSSPPMAASLEEDIHRLVEYHHRCPENLNIFSNASHFQQSTNPQMALPSSFPSSLSILAENPWTWNPISDNTRDYRFRD